MLKVKLKAIMEFMNKSRVRMGFSLKYPSIVTFKKENLIEPFKTFFPFLLFLFSSFFCDSLWGAKIALGNNNCGDFVERKVKVKLFHLNAS